jgi:ABC-type cobalamin/Fe3+-siderophores transport system ATPase subunit
MTAIDDYRDAVKAHAKDWDVDDPQAIRIAGSIVMVRDGIINADGFVQAVLDNNLYAAVNNADNVAITNLRYLISAKNYVYLNK